MVGLVLPEINACMKTLVFATNNKHKLDEIRQIFDNKYIIKSLKEIECIDELPEEKDTLQDNALQKAQYVFDKFHCNCFADDTGLEVEALNGRPGVYSARYSGDDKQIPSEVRSKLNMQKLLAEMQHFENRKARFRTVIALIQDGKHYFFEGIVEGKITTKEAGIDGFGYDPIFVPDGHTQTFAEMSNIEKNNISHRARAVNKLHDFLSNRC